MRVMDRAGSPRSEIKHLKTRGVPALFLRKDSLEQKLAEKTSEIGRLTDSCQWGFRTHPTQFISDSCSATHQH
jgi:hypothetical protein